MFLSPGMLLVAVGLLTTPAIVTAGDSSEGASTVSGKPPAELAFDYLTSAAKARNEFRSGLAEIVRAAEKVEIFLLSDEPEAPHEEDSASLWDVETTLSDDRFPVLSGPVSRETRKILSTAVLQEEPRKRILGELAGIIARQEPMPERDIKRSLTKMCGGFRPVHGLRVYAPGGRVIFSTALCYTCEDLCLQFPDGSLILVDLGNPELIKLLRQEMPIPPNWGRFPAHQVELDGNPFGPVPAPPK